MMRKFRPIPQIGGFRSNSSSKKQNNGPTLISLQGTPRTSHPSSKITSQPPKASSSTLHVPSWGGTLNNTAQMVTQSLTNTCPIDNYLTIFYVLLTGVLLPVYSSILSCLGSGVLVPAGIAVVCCWYACVCDGVLFPE